MRNRLENKQKSFKNPSQIDAETHLEKNSFKNHPQIDFGVRFGFSKSPEITHESSVNHPQITCEIDVIFWHFSL